MTARCSYVGDGGRSIISHHFVFAFVSAHNKITLLLITLLPPSHRLRIRIGITGLENIGWSSNITPRIPCIVLQREKCLAQRSEKNGNLLGWVIQQLRDRYDSEGRYHKGFELEIAATHRRGLRLRFRPGMM